MFKKNSHVRINCSFGSVLALLLLPALLGLKVSGALINLPGRSSSEWTFIGKANTQNGTNSTTIEGGYMVNNKIWTNSEISFDARAPAGTEQVQIWAGFYFRDRDSRYVFALRGGHDNDLYLARYAPCIFRFVLLGSFEKDSQTGVIRPVATGRMTVRTGTSAPGIRCGVMRPLAGSVRAHCPKLEPLLEHDNSKIS